MAVDREVAAAVETATETKTDAAGHEAETIEDAEGKLHHNLSCVGMRHL